MCHQSAHLGGYELLAKFDAYKVLAYLSNLRHISMVMVLLWGKKKIETQICCKLKYKAYLLICGTILIVLTHFITVIRDILNYEP